MLPSCTKSRAQRSLCRFRDFHAWLFYGQQELHTCLYQLVTTQLYLVTTLQTVRWRTCVVLVVLLAVLARAAPAVRVGARLHGAARRRVRLRALPAGDATAAPRRSSRRGHRRRHALQQLMHLQENVGLKTYHRGFATSPADPKLRCWLNLQLPEV